MTYDLRRPRLHGLIARIPKTHRYLVTDDGLVTAMLLVRAYNRMLLPGLAILADPLADPIIKRALAQIDTAMPREVTELLAA